MKTILVTGTGGRVGAAVARDLLDNGFRVRALDVAPLRGYLREHPERANLETVYADLTDRLAILKAVEGCEGIAHLAAIPSPGHRDHLIMSTNVVGTANILEAAEANGVKRVALASSCCAFGIFFAKHEIPPQYFPLDESHPTVNEDLYGLSKRMNEMAAEAASRRVGLTTVSLRLTTVVDISSGEHMHWRKRHLARGGNWRATTSRTRRSMRPAFKRRTACMTPRWPRRQSAGFRSIIGATTRSWLRLKLSRWKSRCKYLQSDKRRPDASIGASGLSCVP